MQNYWLDKCAFDRLDEIIETSYEKDKKHTDEEIDAGLSGSDQCPYSTEELKEYYKWLFYGNKQMNKILREENAKLVEENIELRNKLNSEIDKTQYRIGDGITPGGNLLEEKKLLDAIMAIEAENFILKSNLEAEEAWSKVAAESNIELDAYLKSINPTLGDFYGTPTDGVRRTVEYLRDLLNPNKYLMRLYNFSPKSLSNDEIDDIMNRMR